jgi:hypothetical protein
MIHGSGGNIDRGSTTRKGWSLQVAGVITMTTGVTQSIDLSCILKFFLHAVTPDLHLASCVFPTASVVP